MRRLLALVALPALAAAAEPEDGIRQLFASIAEAERAGDPDAAAAQLDYDELFRQLGRAGLDDPDGTMRRHFERRLVTELGSPLSDVPRFDGVNIRKVHVDANGERARVVSDHGHQGRFRWYLVRREGGWRIHDFEELEAPIRFSTAAGVVLEADAETKARLYGSLLGILGARTSLLRGEHEDAKRRLEALDDLPPAIDAARLLLLAEARLGLEDDAGALEACDRAEALGVDLPAAALLRAFAYWGLGDWEKALASASRYRDAAGSHVDAWTVAGVALHEMGRDKEAAAACREALKEDPHSEQNVVGLLLALPPEGKGEIAPYFRRIEDKEAAFASMAGRVAEDVPALEALVALFREAAPGHGAADYYEGVALLARDQYARAAEAFLRALGKTRDPERRARCLEDYLYAMQWDGRPLDGFRSLPEQDRERGFSWLADSLAEARDAESLEELLRDRRMQGGAGAEVDLWEAEALWIRKKYEDLARFLGQRGEAIRGVPSEATWRVPDRWVRCLVRLGRAAEALERARMEEDVFLELLAHAALGDAGAAEGSFEACLEAGLEAADVYADEDLGPLLQGPRFEALRRKHPG